MAICRDSSMTRIPERGCVVVARSYSTSQAVSSRNFFLEFGHTDAEYSFMEASVKVSEGAD